MRVYPLPGTPMMRAVDATKPLASRGFLGGEDSAVWVKVNPLLLKSRITCLMDDF
jgi:hypothetical protein